MTPDRTVFRHVWILFFILLVGTGFRLAVISQVRYVAASGYSSYMKSTLNFASGNREIGKGEGEWRDGRELFNKLFTLEENGINYSQLFQQLTRSNHPPLYYYILHTVIGVTHEKVATLNIGFLINLIAFWVNVILVYFLSSLLFTSRSLPLFSTFLYSVSFLSMEPFLLHKGYELNISFLLLILYFVFRFFEKDNLRFFHYFLFGLACFLALSTHYYSYLYIAGICLVIFIQHTWIQRDFRRLFFFGISTVISVITASLIYPPVIYDLITDFRSVEIQEKLVAADSIFLDKMTISFQMFVRDFLSTPYQIFFSAVAIIIFLAVLTRPLGFTPKALISKYGYIFLGGYFVILFILITYISPYDSLRYVFFLLPIFPVLVVGLLQILPKSFQLRSALLFSALFVSFNIYGLAKVSHGEWPGGILIPSWRTESVLAELQEDASIIILSRRVNEKIRPVLYHASPREIAFCINEIPEDLFRRDGTVLIFVDMKLPAEVKSENIEKLTEKGFERSRRFRGFVVFRRDKTDGLQE